MFTDVPDSMLLHFDCRDAKLLEGFNGHARSILGIDGKCILVIEAHLPDEVTQIINTWICHEKDVRCRWVRGYGVLGYVDLTMLCTTKQRDRLLNIIGGIVEMPIKHEPWQLPPRTDL